MSLLRNKLLEELAKFSKNGTLSMDEATQAFKRFRLPKCDVVPICSELEKEGVCRVVRKNRKVNIFICRNLATRH